MAIHNHMVTNNPRMTVSHNGVNTWKLHIRDVQRNDSGHYMCQINTEPMVSQIGMLEVGKSEVSIIMMLKIDSVIVPCEACSVKN